MNDEEAKAVQEVSKTTSRLLDSVDALGRFVEDAFGYPIREAGGFMGDWIKFKRDNWRAICERAKGELDAREVERIEPIVAKYGVKIIEKSSLEDDETIQSMWAELLANWLDPSVADKPGKIFIAILSELEPLDARILKNVWNKPVDTNRTYNINDMLQSMQVGKADLLLSLQNLSRLSLIAGEAPYGFASGIVEEASTQFLLTGLGVEMRSRVS